MVFLENVYHDFPRLAKQSGFHFHLDRGKVNWLEIENLDLNEIIENENYQLLEQNLSNVVNCNLEKEYDLTILDQNFVKLFKLAQLGVDYLSYFGIYLDKCVILLQEQLIAFREECDLLKRKELNKSEKKKKTLTYQCKKCEKVFISDMYLKFHDKRRHSNTDFLDKPFRKCLKNDKETLERKKSSISTQTSFFDEMMTVTQENGNEKSLLKIEKLEQEMQELKERLKKAETTNEFPSSKVGEARQYDSILLFLPSYLSQSNSDYERMNPECQTSVPQVLQPNCIVSHLNKSETSTIKEIQKNNENFSPLHSKLKNKVENEKEEAKLSSSTISFESFQEFPIKEIKTLKCKKEDSDKNIEKDLLINLNKPQPPPRKLRRRFRKHFRTVRLGETAENENKDFSNISTVNRTISTEKTDKENVLNISDEAKRSLSKINMAETNSIESFDSEKSVSTEPQFKSFIKKIVTKSSPKLSKISRNIIKSFSNRYDSGSTIGKKVSNNVNLKTVTMDKINNHLTRLGVDPEWSGIPKKTMKQKLNVLKHQRRVLSKANPMYSAVRQNVEEKIFQKLKKIMNDDLHNQQSVNTNRHSTENTRIEDVSDLIRAENPALDVIETESESIVLSSEKNFSALHKTIIVEERGNSNEPKKKIHSEKRAELEFSPFQVGKTLNIATHKEDIFLNNTTKKCGSDFDSESDFSDSFNYKTFKTLNSSLNNQNQSENENFDTAKHM